MSNLTIKDVDFNGSTIRAAKDEDGNIWVGARWICEGIGLSYGQRNRQIENIKNDIVLSKGVANLRLLTNGGNQDVLCLKLDFIPLWLAKISITPKMKENSPELVEKLVEYQLKVKNVLFKAFLENENQLDTYIQTIQLQLPSYEEKFQELNRKVDKLYEDIGKFVHMMMGDKMDTANGSGVSGNSSDNHKYIMSETTDKCREWKRNIYDAIENVLKYNSGFKESTDVMAYIYEYMRKNYGIVWEQEKREYKEKNGIEGKISIIDVVYYNKTFRSIFGSILKDIVDNIQTEINLDDVIAPLIHKYDDRSLNGAATYRRVYIHMADNYKVSWKNHTTRFMKNNGTNISPSKKELILAKPKLRKIFEKSVNEMVHC